MQTMIRTEADRDPEFAAWFTGMAGADVVKECIHCGTCSGCCPLAPHMDLGPRRLMYLAREGFRTDVLASNTMWLCTSCYACTVQCPRQIPVTEIIYALKPRAIESGTYPKHMPIPEMARVFHSQVASRGRMSEVWLVLRLYLKTGIGRLFGFAGTGFNLLRTGRVSLRLEHIERRGELAGLLDAVESKKGGAAA